MADKDVGSEAETVSIFVKDTDSVIIVSEDGSLDSVYIPTKENSPENSYANTGAAVATAIMASMSDETMANVILDFFERKLREIDEMSSEPSQVH